jgi:hypothetical protein
MGRFDMQKFSVVSGKNTFVCPEYAEEESFKPWGDELRGAVALMTEDEAHFVGVAIVTLLSIQPLRYLLIDKPFMQPGHTYRLSNCLGNLAQEVWSRNGGVLKPSGLIRFMKDKFHYEHKHTPYDVINYTIELLDQETVDPGEIRSERLMSILMTNLMFEYHCQQCNWNFQNPEEYTDWTIPVAQTLE